MLKNSYRPKEVAEYLGIGLSTVWLYIKQGKLKKTKLSDRVTVITKDELDKFIEGGNKNEK